MRRAGTRSLGALCLLIACFVSLPARGQAEEFQVIVHTSNPVSVLRKEHASRLFRGKATQWDHGGKVMPVDRGAGSDVRAVFSKKVLGKSVGAMRSYWQQQIFSGRGVPPPELRSDSEVIAYVQRNPGAIGYVSAGAALRGVKAIEIRR